MAAGDQLGLFKLTRRHAIKLSPPPGCSVEDCSLAVGKEVGYGSIKSASRMNSAVVIFLDDIDKANQLIENGVVIQDTFIPVLSLVNPAKKVIISNVPPFFKNEVLAKELQRHGQLVSPIKLIPMSCKSPHLKHVMSFRRQMLMVLKNNDEELNLVFKFKIDGYDYTVHATSETMKCFGCGTVGHLVRSCPERLAESTADAVAEQPSTSGAGVSVTTEGNKRTASEESDFRNPVKELMSKQRELEVQQDPKVDANSIHIVTRLAESALLDEENVVCDSELAKQSIKRKELDNTKNAEQASKVSKLTLAHGSQSEEKSMDSQESVCEFSADTQVEADSVYSFTRLRSFLQDTKGMRSVRVDDFFPDLKLFLDSVKLCMKNTDRTDQSIFSDQEVYRLKKLMLKVRSQIANDG